MFSLWKIYWKMTIFFDLMSHMYNCTTVTESGIFWDHNKKWQDRPSPTLTLTATALAATATCTGSITDLHTDHNHLLRWPAICYAVSWIQAKNYVLTALSSNCVIKCARQTSPTCRATHVMIYCKCGALVSLLRAGQNCPARWTNCPFALENISYTKMRKKDTHQTVHSAVNVRAQSRSSVLVSTTMRHTKAYAHVIMTRATHTWKCWRMGGA